jgi:hypothetical protein
MGEHVCTPQCIEWHKTHPIRGMKPNTIPKGDPRHLNEIGKRHAEQNKKLRK